MGHNKICFSVSKNCLFAVIVLVSLFYFTLLLVLNFILFLFFSWTRISPFSDSSKEDFQKVIE